jgi:hypothetical protein
MTDAGSRLQLAPVRLTVVSLDPQFPGQSWKKTAASTTWFGNSCFERINQPVTHTKSDTYSPWRLGLRIKFETHTFNGRLPASTSERRGRELWRSGWKKVRLFTCADSLQTEVTQTLPCAGTTRYLRYRGIGWNRCLHLSMFLQPDVPSVPSSWDQGKMVRVSTGHGWFSRIDKYHQE